MIDCPSLIVSAIVRVLVDLLFLVSARNLYPSATALTIVEVLLRGFGFEVFVFFLAILFWILL